jgi:hypothetical protein
MDSVTLGLMARQWPIALMAVRQLTWPQAPISQPGSRCRGGQVSVSLLAVVVDCRDPPPSDRVLGVSAGVQGQPAQPRRVPGQRPRRRRRNAVLHEGPEPMAGKRLLHLGFRDDPGEPLVA